MSEAAQIISEYTPILIDGTVKLTAALTLFIIGSWFASRLANIVKHFVNSSKRIDNTLGNFFASLMRWGVTALVIISILGLFGIETASFAAVLGATTLAIGLALQGTLSNVAAGVMLLVFRPYKLGDYVEIAGKGGTVTDLNLFTTELSTPDNVHIIIPNGQAWGDTITNYSYHKTRRADIVFGVDYDDDIDKAIDTIRGVIAADMRVLKDPEPFVKVTNLNDSSVDITTRSWCQASDYWDLKFDLTRAVKLALDDAGISIPYPHTIMVHKN